MKQINSLHQSESKRSPSRARTEKRISRETMKMRDDESENEREREREKKSETEGKRGCERTSEQGGRRRIGLFAGVVIGWSCSGSREMISIGVETDNASAL